MSFAHVPKISKSQINQAGDTLRGKTTTFTFDDAIDIANQWRAPHAYPINTFQSTLRKKLQSYKTDFIVAQRLKRMSTIIDKLKRYPDMQLTTMQDIGGVRAVVDSIHDVYKLVNEYEKNKSLPHELYNKKDHISNPRDEDGYRSVHLMYKYQNVRVPEYNGLRLELQIRTKLQHTWATAVETMGTFLGQALKSRQGDKEWLDFFATVSSAFACIEGTSVLPRHNTMDRSEIFKAVAKIERKIGAIKKMRGFYTAANEVTKGDKRSGWSYHLIILNSLHNTVEVRPYNRGDLNKALEDYSQIEIEALRGSKIEPVLVSAGQLKTLRRAYPNFFLDISEFCKKVEDIVTTSSSTNRVESK